MKYLIILLALSLNACTKPESFFSKDCIYHNWKDGDKHCPRYNVVSVDRSNYQPYYQPHYYYPPQARWR